MSHSPGITYLFNDFRLDAARRLLWHKGELVQLTPRVFDTLVYMVEHPNTVLDKERIMEAVWPDSIVEENNLNQNVSTLRRVFGERPGSHRYIVTVPGRGYRFVAHVRLGDGAPSFDNEPTQERRPNVSHNVAHLSPNREASQPINTFTVRLGLVLIGSLIVAAAFVFGIRGNLRPIDSRPATSIAVLPFENLSANPENGYLASGIQDEILSDLAKISHLKVISRTSVNLYKASSPRNAREIGDQLGVTHLLEGSVQNSGDHLRIHAQLIDTKSDSHLWAQTYDRDLADIFTLQREIAQAIADQLQIKISEQEKASIAEPETNDLLANNLYAEALAIESQEPVGENQIRALDLLDKAVARDPRFVMAYCLIARINLAIYLYGGDHTEVRLQKVTGAIQKATDLRPDSGQVHLTRAFFFAFGSRDYDRARAELDFAQRTLPNNAAVYHYTALIDRRQGRWTEAIRNFERALELDPKNAGIVADTASTYQSVHRYTEAAQMGRRYLAILPNDYWGRLFLPTLKWQEFGDIKPFRTELNAILAEEPDANSKILGGLFDCAILERAPTALDQVLAKVPPEGMGAAPGLVLPRRWFEGYAAYVCQRPETARPAFEEALPFLRNLIKEQADNALAWSKLGLTEAFLGNKAEAIQDGRKACELLPESMEATSGRLPAKTLTKIYAIVGENDLAIEQLTRSVRQPMGESYGELKLDPDWDSLRSDPRFEKILVSLSPKQ